MTFVRQNRPIPQFDTHERFLSKISVNSTTGCWEWNAGKTAGGYGIFMVPYNQKTPGSRSMPKRNFSAHRVSYEIFNGPLRSELVIDHMCRNRACVNPNHLREVTENENALENNSSPLAINSQKTHCIHGHEFTPSNIARQKNGGRKCRICKARSEAKVYAKGLGALRKRKKELKGLF